MNIAYLGPLKDYSGYGEANRHAVAALDAAGINVLAQLVTYAPESTDYGSLGPMITKMANNRGEYKIKILHTTPDQFRKHIEVGKYHIGHFFWETSQVPEGFAAGLRLMNEIWTGSQANVDAIRKAGIKTPIFVYPQAIETDRQEAKPYIIPGFTEDDYLFYSIFEWTERKNPEALLTAYWREFEGVDNVGLLVKTYFKNFTYQNKQMIREQIRAIKIKLSLNRYAPVFLYTELMDRNQMMRIHKTGDCFVSAHRGEGWGIPQVEAALAGHPVISTGYGGVNEYFTDKKDGFVVPYKMVPVHGMDHSRTWYCAPQMWAEIDSGALRHAMRFVYSQQDESGKIGQQARRMVVKNFNLKSVGKLMADRLKEIEQTL